MALGIARKEDIWAGVVVAVLSAVFFGAVYAGLKGGEQESALAKPAPFVLIRIVYVVL